MKNETCDCSNCGLNYEREKCLNELFCSAQCQDEYDHAYVEYLEKNHMVRAHGEDAA